MHGEMASAAGAPGINVVNRNFVPVRANGRAHRASAAHHRTALAVQDSLLNVARSVGHPLVGPESASIFHGIGGGAQFPFEVRSGLEGPGGKRHRRGSGDD